MTLFVYDPSFLEHRADDHPECPERLTSIVDRIGNSLPSIKPRSATEAELALVHKPEYIESIREACAGGGGWVDADTYLTPRTYEIAKLAAGALLTAVEEIQAGRHANAFCAVRPPGHHATPDRAMGFCIFNNVAVAAKFIQNRTTWKRILIVDFDVHHGNGTQEVFERDATVAYLSTHRYPFYPGTGESSSGNIINLPFAFGTPRESILETYEEAVRAVAERFRPEFVLVSAGFDAYKEDPIGGLGLEIDDYRRLMQVVAEIAPAKRVVSTLEGGYHLQALGECAWAHLAPLAGV